MLQADRLTADGIALPPTVASVLAEERRLFYVAVTRARNGLNIYAPVRYHHRPRGMDDAAGLGTLGYAGYAIGTQKDASLTTPDQIGGLRLDSSEDGRQTADTLLLLTS